MAKRKGIQNHEFIFLLFTAFGLVALATTMLMLQVQNSAPSVAGISTQNQAK